MIQRTTFVDFAKESLLHEIPFTILVIYEGDAEFKSKNLSMNSLMRC